PPSCHPERSEGSGDSSRRLGMTCASVKQIELIPVIIENYSTPRLATDTEKETILKKVGATTNVITP
nr:hypothetical protein [bacterium]